MYEVFIGSKKLFTLKMGSDGTWKTLAEAQVPRLYHSVALLLPDGRVLTAGGGAPGPVTNLNGEIYEIEPIAIGP